MSGYGGGDQGGGNPNVTQGGGFDVRLLASTPTVGTVTAVQGGNTWTVQQGSAPWSVSESGGWDVRLLASTPTVGGVNATQTGGWDVRIITGTATAATTTAIIQKSNTAPSLSTQNIGLISTTTLAANTTRKSFWVQNTGTQFIYLGFGQTPTSVTYHIALGSCTTAHDGRGALYSDDQWLGAVNAIAGVATGTVTFGEFT